MYIVIDRIHNQKKRHNEHVSRVNIKKGNEPI